MTWQVDPNWVYVFVLVVLRRRGLAVSSERFGVYRTKTLVIQKFREEISTPKG